MLPSEEYIEQAHFFHLLGERILSNTPMQEVIQAARMEILATTQLPMAVDFLLDELRHTGVIGSAMQRLAHYFAAFQTYVVQEAEHERGRFDLRIALTILEREAKYRAEQASPSGLFLFQFETLCRNRLRYDQGLAAMADDPAYDESWKSWILTVRRQVGIVELADMIFVRSDYFEPRDASVRAEFPALFGEREGKIAKANRKRDPLYLFSALQRHLHYPAVPRPTPVDDAPELVPQLMRRVERLETRLKMMEEEQRHGSVDLSRFFESGPPS